MEVVERVGAPFSRRNVQEWSRLDQLTGLLEHARVETDHWTASTSNSSHHFGKVVDSRSRNLADGGQEQRQQTKQLEVFQTTIPGGSLQVIRSSTTSSWQSHKTLSGGSGWTNSERLALPSAENQDFDHLKLTLNPLDLSSQKTKASVGRSGSISSRRPPSRPRSIVGSKPEEASEPAEGRRLTELSAICHKVHEQAKKESERLTPLSNGLSCDQNDNISNEESNSATLDSFRSTAASEVTTSSSDSRLSNSHVSLFRKKSCSSEDLHTVNEEQNETDSSTSEWRRSSKVRRSLQFPPKPSPTQKETIVIPVTKSVAEIKKEIEARKQLVTNSFKTNQWSNLAELEGVLGVVSNGNHDNNPPKDSSDASDAGTISPTKTKKRQTFITVESLKEVRGRLRKLNSPVDEILRNDDVDDGIDTEVKPASPTPETPDDTLQNSVKSYVFGMEVMLRKTKPPITGTGSLESRSSTKSLTNSCSRSDEWYNRRKSYGFEQVSNQQNNCSTFEKSKIESSTDSGICRSSDTFPSWPKLSEKSSTNQTSPIKTTHSIIIKPYQVSEDKKKGEIENGAVVQKGRKTVVNLTNNTVNTSWSWNSKNGELKSPKEDSREVVTKGKIADAIRSLHEKSTLENQRLSEPITISIPIQQTTKTSHTDPSNLLLKQSKTSGYIDKTEIPATNSQSGITPYSELLFGKETAESSGPEVKSLFENIAWRGGRTKTLSNFFDSEFKRHSIAVDQAKYLTNKKSFGSYHFNGINDASSKEIDNKNAVIPYIPNEKDQYKDSTDSDHESSAHEKRQKKVEFCKTEVHFAAEPGRFNIVETDGKPPPNNLYRRRRKTTSDVPVRSGLPEIRFGDTPYEKTLLSTTENTLCDEVLSSKPQALHSSPLFQDNEKEDKVIFTQANTTIAQNRQQNNSLIHHEYSSHTVEAHTSQEEDTPKPRSILKNNIPKPKPYLLGESPDIHINEESSSWGVKLKSVKSDDESPKWPVDSQLPKETEFQKLLKSLRPAATKPPDLFDISSQPEQSSTAADNGLEVRISSFALLPDHRRASWSVSDRVRHSDEARGYSTKVNFGPQETTVVDSDKSSSRFSTSEGLKSSWLIKEQNSSFDIKPAEQEPCLTSTKRLSHSKSFSASTSQSLPENSYIYEGNVLKSTSLVMEVQNPSLNYSSEKKISVKEVSTNLTRDNCERNFQKKEPNKKNACPVSEKIRNYSQGITVIEKDRKKIYSDNTKTIPPVRKTSSGTQTYFVNRSTVRKELHEEQRINDNSQRNKKCKSPEKSLEAVNGLPGVLDALDDLSRCIDEVIIESPQKVCKKESNNNNNVFKVKEDYKRGSCKSQNILSVAGNKPGVKNQLDLLREIVDSGELSEDSLKADEEVRAYMSTDNDEDALSSEWSGSWSRLRTLKQNPGNRDLVPRISPSFGSGLPHRQGPEAIAKQSEAPRVTSISLHYNEQRQPNISTTTVRPAAIYRASSESSHPVTSFVSRNLLNTESSGICSKVELSSSGERTWSFSKVPTTESVFSKVSESDYFVQPNQHSPNQKDKSRLFTRDLTTSPSRFSRNSQSPTKESLFLERTAERNSLYNDNNRQMSSSPTSGTSGKNTSSTSIKVDTSSKKSDQVNIPSKSFITQTAKSSSQSSVLNLTKHKVEDKVDVVKKNDIKKSAGEVRTKERKLSTSSSGRDGWLNMPKEVQARKKLEPSIRKHETKKENKTNEKPLKISSAKSTQKRTESPIYQNREIYAERKDSNDNTETESTILEELTKAADQILLAVNGYTDDDSFRASSDDEYRKRREKATSQPLCTISEMPTKKTNTNRTNSRQSAGVIRSTRSTDLRKEYRSSSKTRVGKTSSNSSMESGDIKPLLSSEDRSKRRAARLLQRASSRELLFTTASSSEDIGSGSDTGSLRAKRVFRRPRLQNGRHGSKQDLTSTTAESRTKERIQRTSESRSTEAHKAQKVKTQTENRCSRHSKAVTGSSAIERRERRPQAVVTQGSRTQKKKTDTSQLEGKCG